MASDYSGYLNVLKPTGMTSHDVVYYVRRHIRMKKVGHMGTLDPDAAGVLPLCIGKATRLAAYVQNETKEYRGEACFGIRTASQDRSGERLSLALKEALNAQVNRDRLEEVFAKYEGILEQTPPMVSAVKYQGKKLYEWARAGKDVPRRPRRVRVFSLTLVDFYQDDDGYPRVLFDVVCSKGTYIRTLCADMGETLGVGAHMSYLLRTKAGPFPIDKTVTLEELKNLAEKGDLARVLYPLDYPLDGMLTVHLTNEQSESIVHGRSVRITDSASFGEMADGKQLRLYSKQGQFLAIGEKKDQYIKPKKVFIEETEHEND